VACDCINAESEVLKAAKVRLYRALTKRATAGVGELEVLVPMHKWSKEHNNTAGLTGSLDVHRFQL
jgi:hypothetical protein